MNMSLTVAEAFYVEAHAEKKTPAEIAKDLGLTARKVRGYLKKLEAARPKPPGAGEAVKAAGFENESTGTVAMTGTGSQIGDEFRQKRPVNERFYKERLGGGVHKIRPDDPIR